MAVIGASAITMADIAKTLDPNGAMATVINLLAQQNEIMDDIPWMSTNKTTSHLTTVRTGLPTPGWRRFNEGAATSKGAVAQFEETCGIMEGWSEVDEDLANLYDNPAAFRMQEDAAWVQGMTETLASTLFYGSKGSDPRQFDGLATRYSSLTGPYADSMLSAGGSGSDNTSVWIVTWSDNTVHGIYPKNSAAGLKQQDLGPETKADANGNPYRVLRTKFQWQCGLAVRDWRHVVRICNIDVSNLVGESGAADLVKLIIRGLERIPNLGAGRTAIYCNRQVRTMLRLQILAKSNVNLTFDTIAGRRVLAFDGVPVRMVDRLLATEAAIA